MNPKQAASVAKKRFSSQFSLGKTQAELDFVDVELDGDVPLFIDPFAMRQRADRWSNECTKTLGIFFQALVDSIREKRIDNAEHLLSFLGEPNEIRLGLSRGAPKGAGIGSGQAQQILAALEESTAVKTGFLSTLEECELMVDGIARDKISDLTANVIRGHLIRYTREQCELYGIPLKRVAMPPIFNSETMEWEHEYGHLPIYNDSIIILVPKIIARYSPALDHQGYYNHFVLDFLQAQALEASSSLVKTLKRGERKVYKKDVREKFPCSKEYLYQFSKDNPQVLERYKQEMAKRVRNVVIEDIDESVAEIALAKSLRDSILLINAGDDDANKYHSLMLGTIEFLFYPYLHHPVKEQEIHGGRKRIDIVMDNGASNGIFHWLHDVCKIPCPYIMLECKNYSRDPANPELDQISGRFSPQRGKVGILLCRNFKDRDRFVMRCQDTYKDDRGLILPLDDERIDELLELIQSGKRHIINELLEKWYREVILS